MHDIDLSLTTNVEDMFRREKKIRSVHDGEGGESEDFFVEDFTCEELKQLCVTHQFLTRRFRGGASGWTSRGVKLTGDSKYRPSLKLLRRFKNSNESRRSDQYTNQILYKSEISSEIESAYRSGSELFRICVTDRSVTDRF